MSVDFDNIPKSRTVTSTDIGKECYNKLHDDKRFLILGYIEVRDGRDVIECKSEDHARYTFYVDECKLTT